ncbi:GPW/gp25 family protein [Aquimarina aquimarini]|uniref:GPW/gp25 family protein n=1 Tax=Aquimarina aquimarini TaxID=1191734 RepID=UPI000D54C19A|nr:GPW/gp25 family protein [Aquimarina aquimarini]
MIKSYYSLPLQAKKIIANEEADQCDIGKSIANFIHLITTTHFGECAFDETFGCSIWNVDFDNLTTTNRLRDIISDSLLESITTKEKRLKNATLKVVIKQDEFISNANLNRVKKRVDIKINATIRLTNEPFYCIERFYIAPLSF